MIKKNIFKENNIKCQILHTLCEKLIVNTRVRVQMWRWSHIIDQILTVKSLTKTLEMIQTARTARTIRLKTIRTSRWSCKGEEPLSSRGNQRNPNL